MVLKNISLMQHHIERLRRGLWVLKQPLTQVPKLNGVPVSDLFVWRNSEDWKTSFELIDIPGLFIDRENTSERYVTLFFFDSNGTPFLEKRLELIRNQRQTIDLSELLSKSENPVGTFCAFHSYTPEVVAGLGSFIAERGYVSYCYKGAPLRAYVHGNLDAISLQPDKIMQLLGTTSFRAREYRLQHELLGPALYEMAVVNPSPRDQRFSCQVFSTLNGEILDAQEVQLRSRGSHVFPIQVKQSQTARIVLNSRLVMARPLVFRIHQQRINVFHG
jgi:hypothetical protein